MKLYNVSLTDAERIAASLGIRFNGDDTPNSRGARCKGLLRPLYGQPRAQRPYPRISSSPFAQSTQSGEPRAVAAVCWHGHRDFMREVFCQFPTARIVTHATTYRSPEHFEATYRDTGYRNVGSLYYPMAMCEACECAEAGRAA